jgi:GT2 family glycosyltransferase
VDCLDSLKKQTMSDLQIMVVDNGSEDGSCQLLEERYPEVELVQMGTNTGFCGAVNEGIRRSKAPYVLLLNNDTESEATFVQELYNAIQKDENIFSCSGKMIQYFERDIMDDAGDYYCALGWAFAYGKGKPVKDYGEEKKIFFSCAGAAIYRKSILDEIGYFDEAHFAYLEDADIGYRARIKGYENRYIPSAVIYHVGSGTSGSVYNLFKTKYSSRNNVYLVYKNMPLLQILINFPLLALGFAVKAVFFAMKGFGKEYVAGIGQGLSMCKKEKKVKFQWKHLKNYVKIQLELWINLFRFLKK